MKRNARAAYNALVKIGAPVMAEPWGSGYFRISGEMNFQDGEFGGNKVKNNLWASYEDYSFGEFGVSMEIINTLNKYDLYAEWCNPGVLDVYDI